MMKMTEAAKPLTRAQTAKLNRELREKEQAEQEARELAARKANLEASKNSTAGKMLALMVRLGNYGNLNVNVVEGADGPELKITDSDSFKSNADLFWFGNLTLTSESHTFEEVVEFLDKKDAERAEASRLRELAKKTWDELTPDARKALGLLNRPY
jgi:hypothetical protein